MSAENSRRSAESPYSGANLKDEPLESLAPRDRAGLDEFVAELRAMLPDPYSVTVCVEAFTSPDAYPANGYDLQSLASNTDQIVLMTYDDHGPWENTPGPIGPLSWQRASVRALESTVPASQIFLGAANYGYAWRPHSNDNLNVSQARALVARWHAQPRWVASVGEWTAKLRDGSTLWWSDHRSVALRLKLARALGVHGVAVWSLGSGDPLPRTSGGGPRARGLRADAEVARDGCRHRLDRALEAASGGHDLPGLARPVLDDHAFGRDRGASLGQLRRPRQGGVGVVHGRDGHVQAGGLCAADLALVNSRGQNRAALRAARGHVAKRRSRNKKPGCYQRYGDTNPKHEF
jgi:hypothetical protein